jgi:hypothetical protein
MPNSIKTQEKGHQWTMMAYQPVEIVGAAPDGEPFGFLQGEPQQGVNCFACAAPWDEAITDAPCPSR